MIEIRKTEIALEEHELIELERIVTDGDEKETLIFIRKTIYSKVARSQGAKLKSHLYSGGNTVEKFKQGK